ncbi:putative trypsin-6 isoform X2 [Drosophila subpulchrella]|uniref:putative trypsin-6 isoform X2 n=1 Tax=Drosophila subpulchrella TaxID=1486046 RepID=UPI0018A154D7|nr:putative trypsin-6 isoform X2 [Drosophila subpulchrella]
MNTQNYLNLLHFLLILLTADHSKIVSSLTFNRTKRLSDANYDEESFRLAPYVVSIRTRSVHSNRRVLYSTRVLIIVAGTVNRLKYMPKRTFISTVDSMMLPDNFTILNKQDLAILKVTTAFPRNHKYISLAKLPLEPPTVGLKCSVPGWGRMYRGGPLATYLLYINVELIEPKLCAKKLNVKAVNLLCAEEFDPCKAQQPCGGDWGSPLLHKDTVYGIVSVLVGCGTDMPSVYTHVYPSVKWIEGKIVTNGGSNPPVPNKLEYFMITFIQTASFLFFVIIYENLETIL